MAIYAHIVGWGKYLPEKVVTNDDLSKIMDTSDDWIKSRTGISERRFAGKDESTATMAIVAAQQALDRAGIAPSIVDLIIVATVSPEHYFPSTACLVQDAIGASHAGAFDLSAACSGFIYGLSLASSAIQSGSAKVVLVIGAETLSRVLDPQDRTTYPLFGDGAGAVVLQGHPTPGGILATVLGADGSGGQHLHIPAGGSKLPASQETIDQRLHYIKMNGREVYRFATRVMGKAVKQACEKAGVPLTEINLLIPHQANIRIIESASGYLKIDQDKVFINLDRYGNTSAASIPIALCEAIEAGRVQNKDKLVMVGFGGGLTWASTVIQWGLPIPYQRREWWYVGLRWFIYRWARVRSAYIRLSRWLEGRLPGQTAEEYIAPPAKEKSAKEKPVQDKPISEKPVKEKSIQDKPAPEKSVKEKTVLEKPAKEELIAKKTEHRKFVQDKPVPEKPVKNKTTLEKPATEELPPEEHGPALKSDESKSALVDPPAQIAVIKPVEEEPVLEIIEERFNGK